MAEDVGRPTELDDELFLKIRELVLQGKTLKEIAEEIGIAFKTVESWAGRNYQGFAERVAYFRNERRLNRSLENLDEILDINADQVVLESSGAPARDMKGNVITKLDPKVLKIKQETSQFFTETIGKATFSKRNEITGADGQELGVILYPQKNGKQTENPLGASTETGISSTT